MTLREALLEATHRLKLKHIPSPRLCAELLLSHFLDVERTFLVSHDSDPLSPAIYDKLHAATGDRIRGVPLQYITGHQEFYGRDFLVNPSVLIPRPETELVVGCVRKLKPAPGSRIIDVGTGSGCIAVTLALEFPQAAVFAGDLSEAALKTAKANAERLDARVAFVCMDVLDAAAGPFDFVVSNPPYVPKDDLETLQREVRDHEPHMALFDPGDHLAIYKRLIAGAYFLLKPGGMLIAEIGFGMEEAVLALLSEEWEKLPTKLDLQGIPRTVMARKGG